LNDAARDNSLVDGVVDPPEGVVVAGHMRKTGKEVVRKWRAVSEVVGVVGVAEGCAVACVLI
jgi:hypothetical protein